MEEENIFESQQPQNIKRDKIDEVFDLEFIEDPLKPTAGEELDADFTDAVKCFSFSVTGSSKLPYQANKNLSVKYELNVPVDDFDDSIN
jgi:hypothetical protein